MRTKLVLVLAAFAGAAACAKGIPLPGDTSTVKIPAGQYAIGGGPSVCPAQIGNCGSTTPVRPIVLSQPYDIEAHEVTVAQYQACVELGFCCGDGRTSNFADAGELPAEVRIEQARQYCKYRSRRLPTEAEWEVAARLKDASGTLQTYPWGESPPNCGQVPSQDCGSGNRQLPPVGSNSYDKTPLGIFDMAGSVAEWVEDDFTLGVGCRFQVSPALICSGTSSCLASVCPTTAGCQEECQGGTSNMGCGSSDVNGGQPCPVIPLDEASVDPYFVSYDHASQTQGSGCNSSSISSSQQYPMSKGGGAFEPSCAQNPAMRTLAQAYGSSDGNSAPQLGFRCVQSGTRSALPAATGIAKLALAVQPTCGVVRIASVTPDTPPAGWGSQAHVAIGSSFGWATGNYDSALKAYTIDLANKLTFPGTLCPVPTYQSLFNGNNPTLVLAGVPVTAFDVRIQYAGQSGSSNCPIDYTQTVNLQSNQNQGACMLIPPPGTAYCP